jgi:hypothetical protein
MFAYFIVSIFDTPPTWRARSPYLYSPGTGWPSYTPGHWVTDHTERVRVLNSRSNDDMRFATGSDWSGLITDRELLYRATAPTDFRQTLSSTKLQTIFNTLLSPTVFRISCLVKSISDSLIVSLTFHSWLYTYIFSLKIKNSLFRFCITK